jgi:DNA polymerase III sliding clamp (beta) subunit (PCNA family)
VTTVVFETATIADAVKAAERVAPNKGAAFDKASGIVIEVDPANGTVVLKSTNMDLFHMAWIDAVSMEGEPATWRLPSMLFARHMAALPIGSGKEVTFTQVDRQLRVEQGRTKARFNLIDAEFYPSWAAFDPDELTAVKDFGGRIGLVEWAAAKDGIPLTGVHFDGELAIATDRYRLAAVPLAIPGLATPCTVPAGLLSSILKQTGEVSLAVDATQMLLMPDEHTQIRCVLYGEKYLDARRIMENNREYPATVKVKRPALLEVIGRAMNFTGSERFPTLRMFVGMEEIGCMMQEREQGMIGDVYEVPGQATHEKVELKFTPKNLVDALNAAPNDEVEIHYDPSRPNKIVYINGGSGYEAWVMPRRETGETSAS